jgi:predicted MPP superfamily phosphohydrolase
VVATHRFSLAVAGAACIAYGYGAEPYWPAVIQVKIPSSRLPRGSRSLRIVHISDLHSDPKPRLEERLPGLIAAENPDVIVYTGDSINSPAALPVIRRLMTRLAGIAPNFAVKGNWDSWYWRDVDLFGGTGARELAGRAESLDVGNRRVWIAGIGVGHEHLAEGALREVPAGSPTLFLYHYPYPDVIPAGLAAAVDLFCAGHTHGGQVALPFYGAIITLSEYGKKYESGLYRDEGTWMYVNRGIGMEGGGAPQITVIEMVPG